jgi:hypothetical protein
MMCKLPFWMPMYAVSAKEQEQEKEGGRETRERQDKAMYG